MRDRTDAIGATSPGRLSTEQLLSIVAGVVVLVVLTTGIAITWWTLANASLRSAQARLDGSVRQLAAVSASGIRQAQTRYRAVAGIAVVRSALRAPGNARAGATPELTEALQTLRTPTDSGLPIELWRASDGRRVAVDGIDIASGVQLGMAGEAATANRSLRQGLDSLAMRDSLQVGQLYLQDNRAHFWAALPVIDSGRVLGFLLKQSRIANNPQTERTIRELSGDSVTGFYRNVDGTDWTTFGGTPATAPIIAGDRRERPRSGEVLFSEQVVAGTPLVLVMEIPRRFIISGAAASIRRLSILAIVLTIAAGALAWLAGRRVARPLAVVATAVEDFAKGDYERRVDTAGTRESQSLAIAFNSMAERIGESRRALERRENDLRALSDALPQLAWMADPEGNIFWFNARWYEYTGFASTDDYSEQWAAAHEPDLLPDVTQRWNASVVSGLPFEMEVRLKGVDGDARWFLTRVVPVRDGESVLRWFGTSTDIQALREARDAAESASRAKSDFLAAMSHELRTPLNAIGGYAELMEMGLRGPVSSEQQRDLARIRMSQQHLLGLIGGILDLSRIESGRVQYRFADVALDPVLDDVEALIAPQASSHQQELDVRGGERGLVVNADRERLRQILLNLLSNAVRHTPPRTQIVVAASTDTPAAYG